MNIFVNYFTISYELTEKFKNLNKSMHMENILIKALFGHLIGDFFFQTQTMAENKSSLGLKGVLWCSIHVVVYTCFVALFVGNYSPLFLIGVSLPHWIVDRYSIAYMWMKCIGRDHLVSKHEQTPFGAIIYVVIDQTIHAGCLYILITVI